MVKGPVEIHITIHAGVDKDGRVTYDWDAEADVPKGVTPPRIGQWDAKRILEGAIAAMEVKDMLNRLVTPKDPAPAKADTSDPEVDHLP